MSQKTAPTTEQTEQAPSKAADQTAAEGTVPVQPMAKGADVAKETAQQGQENAPTQKSD
jgi:hypothetical protein